MFCCIKHFVLEHGQCEVKCDLKAGQTKDRNRFGLMPDGTPCSHPDIEGDRKELFKLSTRKGRDARCLQGYCYVSLYSFKVLLLL